MHGREGENWKRSRHMWSVPTATVTRTAADSFCKVLPWWVFQLFRYRFLIICRYSLAVLQFWFGFWYFFFPFPFWGIRLNCLDYCENAQVFLLFSVELLVEFWQSFLFHAEGFRHFLGCRFFGLSDVDFLCLIVVVPFWDKLELSCEHVPATKLSMLF